MHFLRSILVAFCPLVVGCQDKPSAPAPTPASSPSSSPAPSISPPPSVSAALPDLPLPTITISAVGDCTFGGGIENGIDVTLFDQMMARHKNDLSYPFSGVLSIFQSDDVTIVNLEGTLTSFTEPIPEGKFHFRGKPSYARILKESGVEVANLANNHTGDFGARGYEDTRQALRDADVGASGNGLVDKRTIRGIEVVNVGFTGVHMTRAKVKQSVKALKKPDNLVIASFHWGLEGTHEIIDIQREFGRIAIDAGADVVLGHHPHVVQAMETYREKHIVHSLGNFVFGANTNPHKVESMIYRETFVLKDSRMMPKSFEVIPVRICAELPCKEFRPVLLEGDAKQKFLDWWNRENEQLGRRPFDKHRQ